jgi:hypothetical protein
MIAEVTLADEHNRPYRALLRDGKEQDRERLVKTWAPVLRRGPADWLDREWPWEELGVAELAFDVNPEWLVLSDEVETGSTGDVLGVLVTTAPITARMAALVDAEAASSDLLWVEYIAIAPSLRRDCPDQDRRPPYLRGAGVRLMMAAIGRSKAMGLGGRLGLHAEGAVACSAYTSWDMRGLGHLPHPAGGDFPVFFGNVAWATLPRWSR